MLFFIAFAVGCNVNGSINEDKSSGKNSTEIWPPAGLYFMKWESYHGYFIGEEPFIQLSLVQVHFGNNQEPTPSYQKYYLLSDNREFVASSTGFQPGSSGRQYSLYTLGLKLPKMTPGIYIIDKLKVVDSKNHDEIYPIGKWVVDIREGTQPDDMKLGKRTFASGFFDWYNVEITNKTKEVAYIKKLIFQLDQKSFDNTLKTYEDFHMQKRLDDSPYLMPESSKAFVFEFNNGEKPGFHKFISLRPFLSYEIKNQNKLMILPTAIYSPSLNDEEIRKLVQNLL